MLTYLHWLYLLVIAAVIILMIRKREVVIPCIAGTFCIGFAYGGGSIIGGAQAVFNAMMAAGADLFDIMLVIALMVSMLKALAGMGADKIMISPAARLIKKPAVAYWILALIMYIASTFFWPTPATALVGTILIPIAVKAGLKPMAACIAINLAGHGMALSGDLVLQGAPSITAGAAGVEIGAVLRSGSTFAFITGAVALILSFILNRKDIFGEKAEAAAQNRPAEEEKAAEGSPGYARFFAGAVPVIFLIIIIRMILGSYVEGIAKIYGGGATALLGGTAALIMVAATAADAKKDCLEKVVGYLREGLLFSINIFAPVIPIAGFFMLGSPGNAPAILGEGAPGLLFELGTALANALPLGALPLAVGIVLIGAITGLDGSGFSGLPLIGALAGSLAVPAGLDPAILAGLGQTAAIWVGGGCLSAWSFGAVASAGVAGVPAADLVSKNLVPVIAGLIISTLAAVLMM